VTQLRREPGAISNWFDELERGLGKRGSTFTNLDAISHDKDTGRFLIREFKHCGESISRGQRWLLEELAKLPRCTAWILERRDPDHIVLTDLTTPAPAVVLTRIEYRRHVRRWWYALELATEEHGDEWLLTPRADDIFGGKV